LGPVRLRLRLVSAPDNRDILVNYNKHYESVSAGRGGAEGTVRLHPTTATTRWSRNVWGKSYMYYSRKFLGRKHSPISRFESHL
jgi:hypothetical protein